MKTVLIALDYNPTAQKVAETGYAIAKSMGAEIYLLHVIADTHDYFSTAYSPIMGFEGFVNAGSVDNEMLKSLTQSSMDFLSQTKNHLYDQSIRTLVKEGDSAKCILACADELEVDVIVVGSHSHRLLEKIVMGSVAESVLNHSHVPVLIVPTKFPETTSIYSPAHE